MSILKRLSLTPSRNGSRSTTPVPPPESPPPEHAPLTVVLTGSTGNFGAYLLDLLLADSTITKIYCLNRSPDAATRQSAAHKSRGLAAGWPQHRVQFFQADFTDEKLGLDLDTYAALARETNLIIHNAWPVDFNRNFSSFKPSVSGVNHFITFALASPDTPPARIVFISSISAASNWGSHAPTSRAFIPETELTDWKLSRTGYGQSKLLSERLLAHAASNLDVPVAIARVGQLSGPVLHGYRGAWPEREWVPSLIRSSAALGKLPDNLGPVESIDWVPADSAAKIVYEIGMHLSQPFLNGKRDKEAQFYHVVNPSRTTWSALTPTMMLHLPKSVRLVSLVEWVDALKDSAEEAGFRGVDSGANPAVKLIDFFDNMQDRAIRFPKAKAPELESKQTAKVSPTLAALGSCSSEWMDMWMRQWNWTFGSKGLTVPPRNR